MNKERIETDLLAIIKEAKNLDQSELVKIPNTNVYVKRGREREFTRLCDNFYELEFNQIIENTTDTVTPVYELLESRVKEETEEYLISQAYEFTKEVKEGISLFNTHQKSLNTINRNYDLIVRELNDLYLKRSSTPDWQQKVDEKNAEVKRLSENLDILKKQMLVVKKNINEKLLEYVERRMQDIRESFIHTSASTKKALAADKETFILESDAPEYNSLYVLSQILKVAIAKEDLDDLIVYNESMIITKDQKEIVANLLPNSKWMSYINKPEELKARETNQALIKKLTEELHRLESKEGINKIPTGSGNKATILASDLDEYSYLLGALRYLNKANDSKLELTPVWDGKAYVIGEDRASFEGLMRQITFGKEINPDTKKQEENEALIKELYEYLDTIADNVQKQQGVSNLPIKSTKVVGDKAWVVLENDLEEANRIIDIIALLQKQEKNLINVWGMANISANDISKFKKLANATKYLGGRIPNTPANDKEMKKIHDALADLIRKAKETENPTLAANGLVLESDYETYKLLEEKYKYLEDAKTSDDLEYVDGVQIDSKYVSRYHEINELINKLLNPTVAPEVVEEKKPEETTLEEEPTSTVEEQSAPVEEKEEEQQKTKGANPPANPFEKNDKEIEIIKARIKELEEKAKKSKRGKMAENGLVLKRDEKEYNLLQDKLKYLEKAKTSDEVVDIDGIKIAKEDVEAYKEVNQKDKKKRRKIMGIRKIKGKGAEFIKENWKQILALGLCITATMYILPTIIPTLIFSNSCLAAAIPSAAGFFNGISSVIAPIAGIPFAPGIGLVNLGANVASLAPALITSLSKLGIVTVAGISIKKYSDSRKNKDSRLSSPDKKTIIQKLAELGDALKLGMYKTMLQPVDVLGEVAKSIPTMPITETDVANAKIEYDANQEDLTDEISPVVENIYDEEDEIKKQLSEEVARMIEMKSGVPENIPAPEDPIEVLEFDSQEKSGEKDSQSSSENPLVIEIPGDEDIISQLTGTINEVERRNLEEEALKLEAELMMATDPAEKIVIETRLQEINNQINKGEGRGKY